MSSLQDQIAALHQQNAIAFSDIHIETGKPLSVRVPLGVVPVENSPPVKKAELLDYLNQFAIEGKTDAKDWQASIDAGSGQYTARFESPDAVLRAALFNCGIGKNGERDWSLALRVMPGSVPEFEKLGLPLELLQWCDRPSGLIIFTGTTGSGKSTSMAACIRYINENKPARIITLEDPKEFVHDDIRSMITQRERGIDFTSFEDGVIQAMRQDPDVLVVGEVNDLLSLRAAVSAALTGHLVITSMHTTNAAQTISRMIDLYPPSEKEMIRRIIADLLVGVVSQRILPSVNGTKRVLAHEVMTCNASIRSLLSEDKVKNIPNELDKLKPTMHVLNTCLAGLVSEDKISAEVALEAAYDRDHLETHWDSTIQEAD